MAQRISSLSAPPPALSGAGHAAIWAAELSESAGLISGFVSRSEAEFAVFGSRLQECLAHAGQVNEAAQGAARAIAADSVQQIVASFQAEMAALEEHARRGTEVMERMDGRLEEALGALEKIPAFDQSFQRKIRTLRALGMATQVESARLGAQGEGFTALAVDVRRLAEQVQEKIGTVLRRSGHLADEMQAALTSVREARGALQGELARVLRALDEGFRKLIEVNHGAATVSEHAERRAGELAGRISGVIASMQFQDITRQRLEHVRDSLERLAGGLDAASEREEDGARAAALAGTVLGLQRTQLAEANEEFQGAVADILCALPDLGEGVESLARELVELTTTAGRGGESILEALGHDLGDVVRTVGRGAERNGALARQLASSAATAAEITAFIDGIDEIGFDLELIAINAIVRSSRTGAEGRPLAVIAQEIQRQSVDARRTTGRVSNLLRGIGEAAEELGELAQGFGAGAKGDASQDVAELKGLLQELRGTNESFRAAVTSLGEGSELLGEELGRAQGAIQLHHHLQGVTGTVLATLGRIEEQAKTAGADLDTTEQGKMLEELAAQYTMESQRTVHRRVIGTGDPGAGGSGVTDDFGDNVELF